MTYRMETHTERNKSGLGHMSAWMKQKQRKRIKGKKARAEEVVKGFAWKVVKVWKSASLDGYLIRIYILIKSFHILP